MMFLQRLSCHILVLVVCLSNIDWTSGSWQRMGRATQGPRERWGYCGDGVWRKGFGERRNPVSINAKDGCDWLGVAR